jgi:hypothetical protein
MSFDKYKAGKPKPLCLYASKEQSYDPSPLRLFVKISGIVLWNKEPSKGLAWKYNIPFVYTTRSSLYKEKNNCEESSAE